MVVQAHAIGLDERWASERRRFPALRVLLQESILAGAETSNEEFPTEVPHGGGGGGKKRKSVIPPTTPQAVRHSRSAAERAVPVDDGEENPREGITESAEERQTPVDPEPTPIAPVEEDAEANDGEDWISHLTLEAEAKAEEKLALIVGRSITVFEVSSFRHTRILCKGIFALKTSITLPSGICFIVVGVTGQES